MHKVQWLAKDLWIIGAGFAAAMHIGKLPASIPILQVELGLSLIESGLLLSCIQCCGMFFALIIGSYNARIGLKNCVMLGLGLLSLSSFLAGFTHSVTALFGMRLLEGLGFLLVTLSGPALIRQLIPSESLSAKMGLWTAYMGGGMGIALMTAPWLIAQSNWQMVWLSYALVTCIFMLGVAFYIPRPINTEQSIKVKELILLTLKHPPAWLIAFIFFCYSGQWLALVGFLPTIYAQNHIDPTVAGSLTAGVSIANAIGTFVCGLLLQQGFQPKKIFPFSYGVLILCALSFYLLTDYLPFSVQYICAFGFSFFGGFIAACVFSQALHLAVHPMTISTTIGLILQLSAVSQFLMPPAIAFMVSNTGNWAWAGTVMMLFSIVGICLSYMLYRWVKNKSIHI